MSADDKALRNATGLVHGWTDVAVPEDTVFARISLLGWQGATHMRRNKDVPSVECAKNGIAFDQDSPEGLRFGLSDK
ncbi:hypothetical protein [Desulfosporosinus sp. OT]|uniref:hypothetical protein n=1 Tax=Desulfosporosinus sp. OT TaxID=913865 RepID=UPI00058DA1BB|nr:hypothetical protein [Desulfosporosinus sp. OT]